MNDDRLRIVIEQLAVLSPGACKLLWVYYWQPDASDAELQKRTGYSARQIRRLRKELHKAGLLTPTRKDDDLSKDQQQFADRLLTLGVDVESARRIVQQYPLRLVEFAITRTRDRARQQQDEITNMAGYCITLLRRTYRLDRAAWGTPGLLDGPQYESPTAWARNTHRARWSYVKSP